MLVNPPFLPEPESRISEWVTNLKEANYSDEKIADMKLNTRYFIPDLLTPEQAGQDDTTGLYNPKLDYHYQSVSLEPGYSLEGDTEFLPVMVEEIPLYDDEEDEEHNALRKERLYKTYGFVLSVADFMTLIGEQLRFSNRKFCVAFGLREYHDEIYHKSGRLYHPDHNQVKLKEGDDILCFHIYELLDENDHDMSRDLNWPFFCHLNKLDENEAIQCIDNLRDKSFMDTLGLTPMA